MPKIFISYRRKDSKEIAPRIYERLTKKYGKKNVFLDTKAITSGQWWQQIQDALDDAKVVVVVIGPKWESEIQQRLDHPDDFVREEVKIAIAKNKSIILAFVDGVKGVDPTLLPDDISTLPNYQGYEILDEPFFDDSVRHLIRHIPSSINKRYTRPLLVMIITGFLIIGILFILNQNQDVLIIDQTEESTVIDEITEVTELTTNTSTNTNTPTNTPDMTGTTNAIATPNQIETEQTIAQANETSTAIAQLTAYTPINTLEPINTLTAASINTATAVPNLYPCEAKIVVPIGSYATAINQIRIRPNSSTLSQAPANPQSVGTVILVIDKNSINQTEDWYQVSDINNTYLGWIAGTYLELSNDCPNS